MSHRNLILACACALLISLASNSRAADRPAVPRATTKKLIEFGWDEPDTGFMRQFIAEMEKTPFDGCVFHVDTSAPGKPKGRLTWDAWGQRAFTEEELKPAADDLQGT